MGGEEHGISESEYGVQVGQYLEQCAGVHERVFAVANEGYWIYSRCSCVLEDTLLFMSEVRPCTLLRYGPGSKGGGGFSSEESNWLAFKKSRWYGVLASRILGLLAFSSVLASGS